jgi:voltage-dependent calcium channel L type alpha-1D
VCLNLLVGGFLMMNIFLAILIDNYSVAVALELEKARLKEEREKEKERVRGILENTPGSSLYGTNNTKPLPYNDDDSSMSSVSDTNEDEDSEDDVEGQKPSVDIDEDPVAVFNDPSLHPSYGYNALCILGSGGRLRHLIFKFVLWPRFDQFILSLIILNCFTLAINEPGAEGLGPTGTLGDVITGMDSVRVASDTPPRAFAPPNPPPPPPPTPPRQFFTYTFIVEFALKLLAFGMLLHPGSYMRNNWNLLDGLIVITSIIELSAPSDGGNMGSLRALRALRALRPLRLVSRFEGLQIVINTMLRAAVPCASVAAVALVFYTVFSIVGMNLFGGKFRSCTDPSKTCYSGANDIIPDTCLAERDCVGDWTNPDSGELEPRLWANPTYEESGTAFSFDDFGSSMTVLFEVASLEMWPSVMCVRERKEGDSFCGGSRRAQRKRLRLSAQESCSFSEGVLPVLRRAFYAPHTNSSRRPPPPGTLRTTSR